MQKESDWCNSSIVKQRVQANLGGANAQLDQFISCMQVTRLDLTQAEYKATISTCHSRTIPYLQCCQCIRHPESTPSAAATGNIRCLKSVENSRSPSSGMDLSEGLLLDEMCFFEL